VRGLWNRRKEEALDLREKRIERKPGMDKHISWWASSQKIPSVLLSVVGRKSWGTLAGSNFSSMGE
jgi:hypothetical protein